MSLSCLRFLCQHVHVQRDNENCVFVWMYPRPACVPEELLIQMFVVALCLVSCPAPDVMADADDACVCFFVPHAR